jgi:hypothetical protein
MPRPAVEEALQLRGWATHTVDEFQAATIASVFGVGYTTLIDHMTHSLELLSIPVAEALKRRPLPQIKESIIGFRTNSYVCVVDSQWPSLPIDLNIGDHVLFLDNGSPVPPRFCNPDVLKQRAGVACAGTLWEAQSQGQTRAELPNGVSTVVRVKKRDFVGLAKWQYLAEEADDIP